MGYALYIECDINQDSPEFSRTIAESDCDLEMLQTLFKTLCKLTRAQWVEFLPLEAGDGRNCDAIRIKIESNPWTQGATVIESLELQPSKATTRDQLERFIKDGSVGTMRVTIGESKWYYTHDGISATISETLYGETRNALFDETRDNCLEVLNGTYNEGY